MQAISPEAVIRCMWVSEMHPKKKKKKKKKKRKKEESRGDVHQQWNNSF